MKDLKTEYLFLFVHYNLYYFFYINIYSNYNCLKILSYTLTDQYLIFLFQNSSFCIYDLKWYIFSFGFVWLPTSFLIFTTIFSNNILRVIKICIIQVYQNMDTGSIVSFSLLSTYFVIEF